MAPERWQLISKLFHSALALEPGKRASFLTEACAGDQSLLKEVESLISSHEESSSLIEEPAFDVAAGLLASERKVLVAGREISYYKIISQIGAGGMGEVYLAEDTRLGRRIALKLLPERFTADAERLRRFEREARAASALNHPNIVTIHEIGRSDSTHFIATEFVEGQTLRECMADHAMSINEVLDIGCQIAFALAASHNAGIVHRDIKPENLMLRRDGIVKVLDFGLAKLALPQVKAVDTEAKTGSAALTDPGVVLGTVQYMSPEQSRGLEVDARTDIFSLGVLLYEMLAGRVPFMGETASDTIAAILEKTPMPLARYQPEAPEQLQWIVSKALRKKREERYQSATEISSDLREIKQEFELKSKLERSASPERNSTDAVQQVASASDEQATVAANSVSWRTRLVARRGRWFAQFAAAVLLGASGLIYLLQRDNSAVAPEAIKSLAVLPLDDLSGDATQDYFADGMTDALITELAKIGTLRVISRSSTMLYKGKRKPISEVARELNVDAVLESSVYRSGEKVRIATQLFDATGQNMWSESYERDMRDVLSLQGEVARGIVKQIKIKITPQEYARLSRKRSVNPEAEDAYLQGLSFFYQGVNAGSTGSQVEKKAWLEKSFDYFQHAIKLDPNYSQAYATLARSYQWLATSGHPESHRVIECQACDLAIQNDFLDLPRL